MPGESFFVTENFFSSASFYILLFLLDVDRFNVTGFEISCPRPNFGFSDSLIFKSYDIFNVILPIL